MIQEFTPLLKNSKFVAIWLSQILSQLTIHVMNFLLLTTLFNQTGSAIATSLLWVAYAIPAIVVGPFGAAASDMVDRRKILVVTNFLQAVTIFAFALAHGSSFFLTYGVVLIYSLLNQFYVPAESAALPSIVSKKLLPQANGLFFMTQQATIILGFGMAGIFNHFLGYQNSLFLCSGFLLMAFISVSFLPKFKAQEAIPDRLEDAFFKFFERIIGGYNFIKENNRILVPFLLLASLQVVVSILAVNLPVLATDLLKISLNSIGLLVVVPVGLGAVLGAFVFPKILEGGLRKRRMIEGSLKAVALSFFLLALVVPSIGSSLSLVVAFLALLISGLAFVGVTIPSQTFLQEATPGGLRGRVFGNFWFIVTIITLLPVLFSGAVTEVLGIRTLLVILGIVEIAAVIFSRKYAYRLVQVKLNSQNV